MSDEKQVNPREELIRGKLAEAQKSLFSSGLTIGEIAQILSVLQANINSFPVNVNLAPPEDKPEEAKGEEKAV
jgi:hypothetical protein